jgi:hypothetical protein
LFLIARFFYLSLRFPFCLTVFSFLFSPFVFSISDEGAPLLNETNWHGKYFYFYTSDRFHFSSNRLFEKALPFQNHLTRVYDQGHYGFINTDLDWVISPKLEWAWNFDGGCAPYSENQKLGLISSTGTFLTPPRFDWISEFSCGIAIFKENKLYGYLNDQGKVILPASYTALNPFVKDIALFFDGTNLKWLNPNGQWTNEPDWAKSFTTHFKKNQKSIQTNP